MISGNWYGVSKFDPRAVGLYSRHYSSEKSGKTIKHWLRHGITPPGESITLLTQDCSALFVWLKQTERDDGQVGVNCAVFRNEGQALSSSLILEAEWYAWERWPGERLFTYVDPASVKHKRDPGRCFKRAGWQVVKENGKPKLTKRGLIILEKLP